MHPLDSTGLLWHFFFNWGRLGSSLAGPPLPVAPHLGNWLPLVHFISLGLPHSYWSVAEDQSPLLAPASVSAVLLLDPSQLLEDSVSLSLHHHCELARLTPDLGGCFLLSPPFQVIHVCIYCAPHDSIRISLIFLQSWELLTGGYWD